MTTTDIKELALAAKAGGWAFDRITSMSKQDLPALRFATAATPDAILALIRERDEARERAVAAEAREHNAHLAVKEERAIAEAAEAALASYKEEVERLKVALADSIRRPMGVIPASAEGLITYADVAAAEERRAQALTKETPHAG